MNKLFVILFVFLLFGEGRTFPTGQKNATTNLEHGADEDFQETDEQKRDVQAKDVGDTPLIPKFFKKKQEFPTDLYLVASSLDFDEQIIIEERKDIEVLGVLELGDIKYLQIRTTHPRALEWLASQEGIISVKEEQYKKPYPDTKSP